MVDKKAKRSGDVA